MATRAVIVTFILAFLVFCCLCLLGVFGYLTYQAANNPIVKTSVVVAFDTPTPTAVPVVIRTPLPPEAAEALRQLLEAQAPRRDLHDLARRLKGAGMRWDPAGADAILQLTTLQDSNAWENYWKLTAQEN